MGKQGHGRRLTDKERMEIIELTRLNPRIKHVELASRYSVNESTIRKWRQKANADKIETRYESGVEAARDARQRGQAVKNAAFDATMHDWICSMRNQSIELPPAKIREKARQLAESFDGMQDFKASSGWYYRFCRRYGLPCPSSKRDASPSAGHEAGVAAVEDAGTTAAAASDVQSAAIAEPEPEHALPTLHESHAEHATNEQSGTATLNGAPAEPTDAASVLDAASYEPILESISATSATAGKRKFDDAIGGNEIENESAGSGAAAAATAPREDAAALSTRFVAPATTSTSQLTTRQEAIAHFLHYHKDLLSAPSRLRFIKHLAHVAGEAEMYSVMDDETRVELIKEFMDKDDSASIPVGAECEGLVV